MSAAALEASQQDLAKLEATMSSILAEGAVKAASASAQTQDLANQLAALQQENSEQSQQISSCHNTINELRESAQLDAEKRYVICNLQSSHGVLRKLPFGSDASKLSCQVNSLLRMSVFVHVTLNAHTM